MLPFQADSPAPNTLGSFTQPPPPFASFGHFTAAGAQINIPNIPQTCSNLLIIHALRSMLVATTDDLIMEINGQTGNYAYEYLLDAATLAQTANTAGTTIQAGVISAGSVPADLGYGQIIIPAYTGSGPKGCVWQSYQPTTNESARGGGRTTLTAPVTSLLLAAQGAPGNLTGDVWVYGLA